LGKKEQQLPKKREAKASLFCLIPPPRKAKEPRTSGAGNEARTRDLNLGKVALYQLSYSRVASRAV
jgi:hypothetical protein